MDLMVAAGVAVNILFAVIFWHYARQLPQLRALFAISCIQVVDFSLLLWPSWVPQSILVSIQSLFYGHYFIAGPLLFYAMSFLYSVQQDYSRHIWSGAIAWLSCSVLALVSQWFSPVFLSSQLLGLLSVPLAFAVICFYLFKALRLLTGQDLKEIRLRRVLKVFLALNILTIFIHLLMYFDWTTESWRALLPALYALFELLLFIAILQWVLLPTGQEAGLSANKVIRKERSTQEQRQHYVAQFRSLVEDKKLFLDSELKIQHVAEHMGVPAHVLSEAINQELDITFQNLINQYRIEHVKHAMLNNQQSKLLDLAMEAGFGSKAAFNRAFKQVEGISPSIWRAQQKSG